MHNITYHLSSTLIVLFPRHTNKQTRDNTINLIHMFRDYLHYHIKVILRPTHFQYMSECPILIVLCTFISLCTFCRLLCLDIGNVAVFEGLHAFTNARQNQRISEDFEPSSAGDEAARQKDNNVGRGTHSSKHV